MILIHRLQGDYPPHAVNRRVHDAAAAQAAAQAALNATRNKFDGASGYAVSLRTLPT